MNVQIESFSYDDAIVRRFTLVTVVWGAVGMLVGLLVGLQLAAPLFNFELPWLSFGRLRPLHTNAVIFAFAGNAIFAGVYSSLQRLLKTPTFSRTLSNLHFRGWQLIIVAAGARQRPLGAPLQRLSERGSVYLSGNATYLHGVVSVITACSL